MLVLIYSRMSRKSKEGIVGLRLLHEIPIDRTNPLASEFEQIFDIKLQRF